MDGMGYVGLSIGGVGSVRRKLFFVFFLRVVEEVVIL